MTYYFPKKTPSQMLDSILKRPLKITKFSRRSLSGANHRDCYNAQRFLLALTLELAYFLYIEKQHMQKHKFFWSVFFRILTEYGPEKLHIRTFFTYLLKVSNADNKITSEACNFIKKETLAQVFSCEFCEISRNTFFTEHLWATVSISRHKMISLCTYC